MERSNSLQQHAPGLWLAAECQAFDQHLQAAGLPALILMEQASQSITEFLISALNEGHSSTVTFLCGPGNNGADAIAAARQLLGHPKITPQIHLLSGPPTPESLLSQQYHAYKKLGGIEADSLEMALKGPERPPAIVVDGVLGVGLSRPVSGNLAKALLAAQESGIPSLAVDCPSGLDCDNGKVLGTALAAKWTISFIGSKLGFSHNQGPHLCGEIQIADIGVRRELANRWLEQYRSSNQRQDNQA